MKEVNFNEYKFRCHALGRIMSGTQIGLADKQEIELEALDLRYRGQGRPLTEKQGERHAELLLKKKATPKLSDGVKTYCEELFKEAVFGRRKEIFTDALTKGNAVEEHSISLYSRVAGKPFFKNTERRSNDFIQGTPDNVQGKIRDIKSSWDIHTFPLTDRKAVNMMYWWQLQGYMWLWGFGSSELIYCLVDTPEELIQDAIRRYSWRMNYIDVPQEDEDRIRHEMTFSDIDERLRFRLFDIDFDPKAIDRLKVQIGLCREYMAGLYEDLKQITQNP